MTRVYSVNAIKKNINCSIGAIPKEGSLIRNYYDTLRTGSVLETSKNGRITIETLKNIYGMEIVSSKDRKGGYILIGEWIGPQYQTVEEIINSAL